MLSTVRHYHPVPTDRPEYKQFLDFSVMLVVKISSIIKSLVISQEYHTYQCSSSSDGNKTLTYRIVFLAGNQLYELLMSQAQMMRLLSEKNHLSFSPINTFEHTHEIKSCSACPKHYYKHLTVDNWFLDKKTARLWLPAPKIPPGNVGRKVWKFP